MLQFILTKSDFEVLIEALRFGKSKVNECLNQYGDYNEIELLELYDSICRLLGNIELQYDYMERRIES